MRGFSRTKLATDYVTLEFKWLCMIFLIAFHGTSHEEVPFSDDNDEHLSDQVCIQENTLEYICYERMLLYNHTVQFKIKSMKENPIPIGKKPSKGRV